MNDSEILNEAINLLQMMIDEGGAPAQSRWLSDPDMLPFLAMEICERELFRDFGRKVLEAMLKRDLAGLLARRAILLSSVRPGPAH